MHFANTIITADTTDEMALTLANIDGRRHVGSGFIDMKKIWRVPTAPCINMATAEKVANRAFKAWEAVAVPFYAAPKQVALLVAYDSGIWDGPEDE